MNGRPRAVCDLSLPLMREDAGGREYDRAVRDVLDLGWPPPGLPTTAVECG